MWNSPQASSPFMLSCPFFTWRKMLATMNRCHPTPGDLCVTSLTCCNISKRRHLYFAGHGSEQNHSSTSYELHVFKAFSQSDLISEKPDKYNGRVVNIHVTGMEILVKRLAYHLKNHDLHLDLFQFHQGTTITCAIINTFQ